MDQPYLYNTHQFHIMVVDDDNDVRDIFEYTIQSKNYKCTITSDGQSALRHLAEKDIDIVVTDIRMPDINGIELLRIIKENYDADVIVMTGYAEDFRYEKMIEIGASDFFIKPLSASEILVRIKRVLRERVLLMERDRAEEALRKAHNDLEKKVSERTFELKQTNEKLRLEIRERMRIEEALRASEEHIRTLTQMQFKTQETERQRIALDLHDHVAQDLSAFRIACETEFQNQSDISEDLKRRISEFSRILKESIKVVRNISYDLRPPSLDQLGLTRTIAGYCENYSHNNHIKVNFYPAGMDHLTLNFDTEINLYRLIQEALNNIKKHASADTVTIKLVASAPDIILRIEDDGKGFDVKERAIEAIHEKRMGLISMEERVKLLKGEMKIISRPMEGTKIFIKVPHKKE